MVCALVVVVFILVVIVVVVMVVMSTMVMSTNGTVGLLKNRLKMLKIRLDVEVDVGVDDDSCHVDG